MAWVRLDERAVGPYQLADGAVVVVPENEQENRPADRGHERQQDKTFPADGGPESDREHYQDRQRDSCSQVTSAAVVDHQGQRDYGRQSEERPQLPAGGVPEDARQQRDRE